MDTGVHAIDGQPFVALRWENFISATCSPVWRFHTTAYNRFNRWRKTRIWDGPMATVTKAHDGKVQMIDSSIVRVHQVGCDTNNTRTIRTQIVRLD
jgi:hypothetical protein